MIVVNPSTRQFNVPGADLVFGVESDNGSVIKEFQCPRYVGNNLDLAGSFIRINYRNANGEIDSYLVKDVTVDGNNIVFGWELTPKVTRYKGQISFVMCVVGPDTKVKWHTTLGKGQVLEGLEPDADVVEDGTADVVAALIAMVEAQTSAVKAEGSAQISSVRNAVQVAQDIAVTAIETAGAVVKASIPADYTALSDAVRGTAPGIVCSAEGEVITLSDASNQAFRGMRIFGKSTQDGIPTPENPVEIVSIENPTITVGEQTLSIPRTLPGIPVSSGGNYTDANGQQWICDEVDFDRGVYIHRIGSMVYDGSADELWNYESEMTNTMLVRMEALDSVHVGTVVATDFLCSHLMAVGIYNIDSEGIQHSGQQFYLRILKSRLATGGVSGFRAFIADSPMSIYYVLKTKIETPLSETELAAYRALHTNKPNTTILNDSGAYMSVEYTADTKLYIDNLIKNL